MSLRKFKRSKSKKTRQDLSSQYGTIDAGKLFQVAQGYLRSGNHQEAEKVYRQLIKAFPPNPAVYSDLGTLYHNMGDFKQAITFLKKALDIAPDHVDALKNLGMTYAELGQFDKAASQYEKLVRKIPNDLESQNKLGILHQKCGNLDQAVLVFKKVLGAQPESLAARFSLVEALEQYNKVDEAYTEVLAGLESIPDEASLHALAATCERRLNQFQKGIDRLTRLDITSLSLSYQRQCYFELGRLYDRSGEYDKAYECFAAGNHASERINSSIDKNYFLDHISLLQQQFQGCNTLPKVDSSLKGRGPVFLFGFPRSGTTLLDQVLDSHPMVQTMEEKDIVASIENRLADPFEKYVSSWLEVTSEDIKTLQDEYFSRVEKHLTVQPNTIFIDRMPLNTMRAALIWRIFPDAKFILSVRHPLDVCLSCFMQDFRINTANANFFTLQDAAFFYAEVMKLWRLYVKKMPFNFHMVRYEDLVADLETEARQLFDFIGVQWDDKALAFHEHAKEKGQIKTASYHQVSQPLYKDAVYRWQRYEKYCEPIREKLAPYIEYFGY